MSDPTVIFSSVPPGTYTVKINWNGTDSSTQTVTVTSGKSSYATFNVAGNSAPTPTPNQKPVCTAPTFIPQTGTAPLTVNIYIGYSSNPPDNSSSDLQTIMWDLNNDGNYEYNIGYGNPYQWTFTSPGTYTVRGSICKTGGTTCSDPCSASITVN